MHKKLKCQSLNLKHLMLFYNSTIMHLMHNVFHSFFFRKVLRWVTKKLDSVRIVIWDLKSWESWTHLSFWKPAQFAKSRNIVIGNVKGKVIIEKFRGGRFLWNSNWDLGRLAVLKKKGLGRLWATSEGGFFMFSGAKKC